MRSLDRALAVAAAVVFVTAAAAAQESAPAPARPMTHADSVARLRKGFFLSLGLAYGTLDLTGSSGTALKSEYKTGFVAYFTLGGSLSPHWRLGVEAEGYNAESQGIAVYSGLYAASATFYPSLTNNFWIKGNLGAVRAELATASNSSTEWGFGAGLGIGYDIVVSLKNRLVLIPYAGYSAQLTGGSFSVFPGETFKAKVFQVGVGFGYKH
jgi:hypothetical protein